MFIAVLFIKPQNGNNPTGKWIHRFHYNGILLSNKMKTTLLSKNIGESRKMLSEFWKTVIKKKRGVGAYSIHLFS